VQKKLKLDFFRQIAEAIQLPELSDDERDWGLST
jgi:hypothetical protein